MIIRHDLPTLLRTAAGIFAVLAVSTACSSPQTRSDETPTTQTEAIGEPADEVPLHIIDADVGSGADDVLDTMEGELERAMGALKSHPFPPYYVAYQVTDRTAFEASADSGALEKRGNSQDRRVDLDVRVGSYELDNTHELRGQPFGDYESGHSMLSPFADAYALEKELWRRTDAQHKDAYERFAEVKANIGVRAPEEDVSGDFSKAPVVDHVEDPLEHAADADAWAERLRRLSRIPEDAEEHLDRLNVSFKETVLTRRQVTSEGSRVRKSRRVARVSFWASATAEDGMNVWLYDSVDVYDPADLPSEEVLRRRIEELVDLVLELRVAPVAEPHVGPAILEGESAGVFFHEALGHRVEGHRQSDEDEGQTFARKLGEPVLPTFLDVFDDPRARRIDDVDLMGHYLIDDQAVRSTRAEVVRDGVLEGFLMSRDPVRGITDSNGHGRREPGKDVVARQGNLIIQPNRALSRKRLRERLIEEIEAQGADYGLRFSEIQGGYTLTGRSLPQSFRLLPLLVYRVYPDGSEELVRGVNFDGTPLTVLSEIVAASDDYEVFNGVCGAESGHVPVSSVSPSLLVRRVETSRQRKSSERPPILPPPTNGEEADGEEADGKETDGEEEEE